MFPTRRPEPQPPSPKAWDWLAWLSRPAPAEQHPQTFWDFSLRYGLALATVAAAWMGRLALTAWTGPGLPPYIVFYPAVMVAALLCGFGPGLLATGLSALAVDYWLLPPVGRFTIGSPVDRLGMGIFVGMGLFVSVMAELYRRDRDKAAAYDREAALRESQRELRDLTQRLSYHVDNSPLAVIEWGPDMRLTRWAGEAERLFGWSAGEVLGKRMEDFSWVYPEDEAHVAEVSEGLQDGTAPRRFSSNRNYRKDGSVVQCEWYNSSLVTESGELRSILSLVLDVTERTRMEARLKEEARRKDDFLALLGHELRNPLAPIGNAVHLLRKAGRDPELADRACAIVERQVAHMVRLVDDLLDISRITQGKVQLKQEKIDLVETLRAVVADYRPILETSGLALTVSLPSRPVWIAADQARIFQVVSNLFQNAAKFTDPGGRIDLEAAADASGGAVVRVKDSGTGIAPEHLASIFEPFMQEKGTIGRSQGGLGLGLALVKGLVELHGGTVAARSEGHGRGSEFTLQLPAFRTAAEAAPPPAAPEPGAPRPRRILIVEDLVDAALTMQLLLQMLGHSAAVAHDGRGGLDQAERFAPEIILCDIGLPGDLDGYEVARRIRATPALRGVHLVALTGFGTPEDKERALRAGFDAHLTKPVDPAVLGPMIAAIPVSPAASA